MNPTDVVETFYQAVRNNDHQTISGLYHDTATFEDPVFGKLNSEQVKAMWTMLLERSKGNLTAEHKIRSASEAKIESEMTARYTFGKKKRPVTNSIASTFILKDGLILSQVDRFNFNRWAGMALGIPGKLLGWTPYLKAKVRKQSLQTLAKFMNTPFL